MDRRSSIGAAGGFVAAPFIAFAQKVGDMPILQPARFELVTNMRTAKALGLAISQLLLLRAAAVIQ